MDAANVQAVPPRPLYPDQAKALAKALKAHNTSVDRAHERLGRALEAMVADGATVSGIAEYAGVTRQTIYEWMRRAHPDPDD